MGSLNMGTVQNKFALPTIFVLLLICGGQLSAQESGGQTSAQEKGAEEKPVAIPITEITDRAGNAARIFKQVEESLVPLTSIVAIEDGLPAVIDSLRTLRSDSLYLRLNYLPPRKLRNLSTMWSLYQARLTHWNQELLDRIQELEKDRSRLEEINELWQITAEAAQAQEAPEPIRDRIDSIMGKADTLRSNLTGRINTILVLQNRISEQISDIDELTARLQNAETEQRSQLFVRDQPDILNAITARRDSVAFGGQLVNSVAAFFELNVAFFRQNETRFYIHLLLFAFLCALMVYFYVHNKREELFDEHDKTLKASAFFVSHPLPAATMIALFLSVWIYPNMVSAVGELIILLLLVAMLRLAPGSLAAELRKPFLILVALTVGDILYSNATDYALLQRLLLLAVTISAIALLAWLIRPGSPIYRMEKGGFSKFLMKLSPIALLALVVALIANVIGSVNLAKLLTDGVVRTAAVTAVLYSTTRVLGGLVALLVRRRRVRAFQFMKTYASNLERWAIFVVNMIVFLVWARVTLRLFGLLEPLKAWFAGVLAYEWALGSAVISVQGIFDFVVILVAALILARLTRIILDMEVFPRLHLPRGVPGAISMVFRYTLVAAGVALAISSLGLDLGKFALIAGALGVGLGFGLQNIIANFVSGLILAFERPIQVGDTVQIADVVGEVRQIGVRSSTVKTYDGSEVIVPNAELISNRVTNWTLSDRRRRIQLPVKVAYDSDPEQVLEILRKVAEDHPGVLDDPQPMASFNGFGDNFLDFTLYYWITENIIHYKTEVALGVHRAIKEAGIDTPRPKDLSVNVRDLAQLRNLLANDTKN